MGSGMVPPGKSRTANMGGGGALPVAGAVVATGIGVGGVIYNILDDGTAVPAESNPGQDRYGTAGYDQLGAGGYSESSAPPPSDSGGGAPAAAPPPPPPYGAPAPVYSDPGYSGGGGGGYAPAPTYAAGPTYANGQASRIPTGPPPPPPTTTGFPRSDWSHSMGRAISSFDPNAKPPTMGIPQPLPSSGGIPQAGYRPPNLPSYQKKPGS